jgi:DNA-binding XRE family transcriptional regulator
MTMLPSDQRERGAFNALFAEQARIRAEIEAALELHTHTANALFGRNLQRLREARGLTQQDVADMVGLTRTSITNQEAGRQATTWATLTLLADALGVALEEFRAGDLVETDEEEQR